MFRRIVHAVMNLEKKESSFETKQTNRSSRHTFSFNEIHTSFKEKMSIF